MAIVGDSLTMPENGWERINDTDSMFTYSGTWTEANHAEYYLGSHRRSNVIGSTLSFKFTGKKIRLIGIFKTSGFYTDLTINIDGQVVVVSNKSLTSGDIFQGVVFESQDLANGEHEVVVKVNSTNTFFFDAIDIIPPIRKLTLKNPTTNQHYSLAEKTLIPLLNASDKNMIKNSIEEGKEIQLDVPFDKIAYINEYFSSNVFKGKVDGKPLSISFN